MSKSQAIIVVTLALVIGYAAGYFTRIVRFPAGFERQRPSSSVAGKTPQKYRAPISLAVEKAQQLQAGGKLQEAQKLLLDQLRIYPQAEEAQTARDLLGTINTELFFSNKSLYGKTEYTVEHGDSLARIAHKLNSTPEMIMRANDLGSTLIHPGDRLVVPDGEFTLTIDLPNERVVVHHGDGFFKQYPMKAIDLPRSSQPRLSTKVSGTFFWKDGERISPASPEIDKATPWVHLARSGYILYGVSEENGVESEAVEISEGEKREGAAPAESATPSPDPDIPPRGIAMLKDDLTELLMLLRRGTPVTIIREHK